MKWIILFFFTLASCYLPMKESCLERFYESYEVSSTKMVSFKKYGVETGYYSYNILGPKSTEKFEVYFENFGAKEKIISNKSQKIVIKIDSIQFDVIDSIHNKRNEEFPHEKIIFNTNYHFFDSTKKCTPLYYHSFNYKKKCINRYVGRGCCAVSNVKAYKGILFSYKTPEWIYNIDKGSLKEGIISGNKD